MISPPSSASRHPTGGARATRTQGHRPIAPWSQHLRYLIDDRDCAYSSDFATQIAGLSVESIRTPIQAITLTFGRVSSCNNVQDAAELSGLVLQRHVMKPHIVPPGRPRRRRHTHLADDVGVILRRPDKERAVPGALDLANGTQASNYAGAVAPHCFSSRNAEEGSRSLVPVDYPPLAIHNECRLNAVMQHAGHRV